MLLNILFFDILKYYFLLYINNMSFNQSKTNLIELTLSNNNRTITNLPLWQKQLWVELIQRNAKESWPYEMIIEEYNALRENYRKLEEQYDKIKDSGEKNVKLGDSITLLENNIEILKADNESLKRENIEKQKSYEKIKEENANLLNSIIKAREIEAFLQNKILELEIQIQKLQK
jgi:hypothetical protein